MAHDQTLETIRLDIDASGEYENSIWYRVSINLASFDEKMRVNLVTVFFPTFAQICIDPCS